MWLRSRRRLIARLRKQAREIWQLKQDNLLLHADLRTTRTRLAVRHHEAARLARELAEARDRYGWGRDV